MAQTDPALRDFPTYRCRAIFGPERSRYFKLAICDCPRLVSPNLRHRKTRRPLQVGGDRKFWASCLDQLHRPNASPTFAPSRLSWGPARRMLKAFQLCASARYPPLQLLAAPGFAKGWAHSPSSVLPPFQPAPGPPIFQGPPVENNSRVPDVCTQRPTFDNKRSLLNFGPSVSR